jgi:hypothetical protein
MVMREKYAVEEVAKSLDKTAAEIDQIEAEGWLKLGSYVWLYLKTGGKR